MGYIQFYPSEFGDNWVNIYDERVYSVISLTVAGLGVTECMALCQTITEFYCLTVNHIPSTRECRLFDYNWKNFTTSALMTYVDNIGYFMYSRVVTSGL